TYPADVCAALVKAGLAQVFPNPTEERNAPQETVVDNRSEGPRCLWTGIVDGQRGTVQVAFRKMRGTGFTSPVAAAMKEYYAKQAGFLEIHPISDLGDEAFVASETQDSAVARLGDLLVRVDLFAPPGRPRPDQAELLLRGMVGQAILS